MTTLWNINITSFRGMGGMAMHYYASVNKSGVKLRVEQIMSAQLAAALNELDESCGRIVMNKEGAETNRFNTEEEARAAGLCVWNALKEEGDGVLFGSTTDHIPWKPDFYGPEEFVEYCNDMWVIAKELNWWDGSMGDAFTELNDIWKNALMERWGYTTGDTYEWETRADEHDEYVRGSGDTWEHIADWDPMARYRAEIGSFEAVDPELP